MNDYKEEPTPATRQLVPEDQRLAVVEQLFGIHFPLRIEPVVYGITELMTQGQYHCGFYMVPEGDQIYQVSSDKYWRGELSTDALGIEVCPYVYSHLGYSKDISFARSCSEHYHWLRDVIFTHPELTCILRAID